MKIKELTIDELDRLFKYELPELISGSGHRMYYWIPGEINTIEPGHGYWYHYRTLSNELSQYGWTIQEYFDILILHINDTTMRPRCPYCGEYLPWSGRLTFGYGGDYWFESRNHFCNGSHKALYMSTHRDEYKKFGDLLNSGGVLSLIRNNPDKYVPLNNDNLERKVNSIWSKFLSLGNPDDECVFYIGVTNSGIFKYGVTANLDDRECVYEFKRLKPVFYSTRVKVAALEAQIKFELENASERIPFIRSMEYFRIAYHNAMKLINSGMLGV